MGVLEVGLGRAGWMRGFEATLERQAEGFRRVLEFQEKLASAGHGLDERVSEQGESFEKQLVKLDKEMEEVWDELREHRIAVTVAKSAVNRMGAIETRHAALIKRVEPLEEGRKDRELWYGQVVDPIHERLMKLEDEEVACLWLRVQQLEDGKVQPIEVYPQKPEEKAIIDAALDWADSQKLSHQYEPAVRGLLFAVKAYREKRKGADDD